MRQVGHKPDNAKMKEAVKMAKATAICKCKECGTEFTREQTCSNRAAADNWAAWAVQNIDLCPECYKASVKAQEAKKVQELADEVKLPEITGVSEKQINYAKTLRDRFIAANANGIKKVKHGLETINHEKLSKVAAEQGMTEEEIIAAEFKAFGLYNSYVVFTVSNASKIIDTLK